MHSEVILGEIEALTNAALCGEVLYRDMAQASVLRTMGNSALQSRDVPVAMEMIALLQHFAPRLGVLDNTGLGDDGQDVELAPGVLWGGSKLLLLIDVPAGQFEDISHWVADSLPSAKIKAMPGILALPFTIEQKGDEADAQALLFPEYFAVFYPHGKADNAFLTLTMRSVLEHEAIGGDWVDAAVARMGFYGLPRRLAEQFVSRGVQPL